MTDWLGIQVFTILGLACVSGIIIIKLLERVTLPKEKTERKSKS